MRLGVEERGLLLILRVHRFLLPLIVCFRSYYPLLLQLYGSGNCIVRACLPPSGVMMLSGAGKEKVAHFAGCHGPQHVLQRRASLAT